MKWSAGSILTALYVGVFVLWLLLATVLFTGLLPGWGLNQRFVLGLLLVWVLAGGWYGVWKTKHEFQEQIRFGWMECLSRAKLTMCSNFLVAAMAPPLLFMTTSSILQNAAKSIDDASTSQMWASTLAWGSIVGSLAAAVVAFIILNEHIHSAISRKVGMIQRESERTASSPYQSEGNRMIQAIKKKLRVPKVPRTAIAWLAGASPFILALIFMYARLMHSTGTSAIFPDSGWIKYLVQHQDAIIQSLIVSSVMVAVFLALLRNRVATLLAGFQPVVIQAMFILTDVGRHFALNLPLAAITVLPLLILLVTFRREIDQLYDQERVRNPIDYEKGNTGT